MGMRSRIRVDLQSNDCIAPLSKIGRLKTKPGQVLVQKSWCMICGALSYLVATKSNVESATSQSGCGVYLGMRFAEDDLH